MVLWAAAWLVPWQELLGSFPLARVVIAVGVFCAPGVALRAAAGDGGSSFASRLLFGFVLSVMAVGLAGLAGSLLELPAIWLRALLLVLGTCALGAGIARHAGRAPEPRARRDLWALVILGAALLVGARLALAPYVGGDDFTHVARITVFQQHEHLGYDALALGGENVLPPRYWLSFWPLWQALLATLAQVHPLALTANDAGPVLAVLGLLAVHELSLALGMSRRRATFAVTAQVALLLCLLARTQPGWLFFDRVAEDKFLAFFVLAPVAFACLARVLDGPVTPGALLRLACAWLALAFSHPTSLGMTCLVGGAWCALEAIVAPPRRGALLALTVLLAITGAAASVRLVPHPFFVKLERGPEARFASVLDDENPQGRINLVSGTPFFGIGTGAAPLGARLLGGAVLLVALIRLRREPMARLVAAALGVVGLAVVPYTGWLLGKLLPPFHLWRILCLVPFGIAAALVAGLVAERLAATGPNGRALVRFAAGALPALLLLAVVLATFGLELVTMTALDPPRGWREQAVGVRFDRRKRSRVPYTELTAMAESLQRVVPPGAVVLGDGRTNNLLPSMSAHVSLVCFRSVHQTMLHGELTREDARRRCGGQKDLLGGKLSPEAAVAFLDGHRVGWVLAGTPTDWLDAVPADLLPRQLVAEAGSLRLYRLGASERPS